MNTQDKELLIVFLFSAGYLVFLLIMLVRPEPATFFPAYILMGLIIFLFFYFELKKIAKTRNEAVPCRAQAAVKE